MKIARTKYVFFMMHFVLVMFSSCSFSSPEVSTDLCEDDIKALIKVPPEYPVRESPRTYTGEIIVTFVVIEDGSTKDIHVVSSDMPEEFEKSVLRAIQSWRYEKQRRSCIIKEKLTFTSTS